MRSTKGARLPASATTPARAMVLDRESEFPRRTHPSARRAWRCPKTGLFGGRRQARAFRRAHRAHPGKRKAFRLEQVPAGLLRQRGNRFGQFRSGGADQRRGRRAVLNPGDGVTGNSVAHVGSADHFLSCLQFQGCRGRRAQRARQGSSGKQYRSLSTGRSSSRSSPTGAGLRAWARYHPEFSAYREDAAGYNPVVYDWVEESRSASRSLAARKLLAEAGYPDGVTRRPASRSSSISIPRTRADDASRPQLVSQAVRQDRRAGRDRSTDWNRFQENPLGQHPRCSSSGGTRTIPTREISCPALRPKAARTEKTKRAHESNLRRLFDEMKNMERGPGRQADHRPDG